MRGGEFIFANMESGISKEEGWTMTDQEMRKLFAFNAWATNRTFEALSRVPEAKYHRDLKASFGSLHGTVTHLVAAEKIWLSRLVGKPETVLMTEREASSLESLKSLWEDVAARMARFVSRLDDKGLEKDVEYVTTEGKRFTNGLQQILQHIVNHSTYHRGQVAAMMRQMGLDPANTDLITFYRHASNKM
jgi:uncharacterized damage-inducible protein DinB